MAVGAKKKDDCPAERMVPVFLIVNGAGFLFDVLLQMVGCVSMVHAVAKGRGFKGTFLRRPPVRAVRGILGFFLFVWFIVGSVYVFKWVHVFLFLRCFVDALLVRYLDCCCCCCLKNYNCISNAGSSSPTMTPTASTPRPPPPPLTTTSPPPPLPAATATATSPCTSSPSPSSSSATSSSPWPSPSPAADAASPGAWHARWLRGQYAAPSIKQEQTLLKDLRR